MEFVVPRSGGSLCFLMPNFRRALPYVDYFRVGYDTARSEWAQFPRRRLGPWTQLRQAGPYRQMTRAGQGRTYCPEPWVSVAG